MKVRTCYRLNIAVALIAVTMLGGCARKKIVSAPAVTPPPVAAPTAVLQAEPSTIDKGQSAVLTWTTTAATDVILEGIDRIGLSGTRNVTPSESTTFRLIAKGPGGTAEAIARVTVNKPRVQKARVESPRLSRLENIFFDYDQSEIRPDQQAAIEADAKLLQQHPDATITIEGYCDERGSIEYNLVLGDHRATTVKDALIKAGVSADRIRTMSYGKEKQFCTEHNRQGHFDYRVSATGPTPGN
jgi:peptidoglycan-associated lipoprotein